MRGLPFFRYEMFHQVMGWRNHNSFFYGICLFDGRDNPHFLKLQVAQCTPKAPIQTWGGRSFAFDGHMFIAFFKN